MATLRNKKKIAVVNGDSQGEHLSKNLPRETNALRFKEEHSTQFSEKNEGRKIKNVSQEVNRRERRILGEQSKLDEFPLNSHLWVLSGTTLGVFRKTDKENQERNKARSQNYPHPEVRTSAKRSPHLVKSDGDSALRNLTK